LTGIAGATIDEYEVLPEKLSNTVAYRGKEYRVSAWLDLLKPTTAEVLGAYGGRFYAGRAAITGNTYGKGAAFYLGAMGSQELISDVLADICAQCGLAGKPLPEGIFVTERIGCGCGYTFIVNMGPEPRVAEIPRAGVEMISGEPISGRVEMAPRDVRIIRYEAERP